MPTVLGIGPYRFFFFAGDRSKPLHIHVERDGNTAKFWLDPVRIQSSGGFNRQEIGKISKIIYENEELLIEAWNEYFND